MDKVKILEINGRTFEITKFDARTGSFVVFKVAGILAPIFQSVDLKKLREVGAQKYLAEMNYTSMLKGLTSLSEEDFRTIQDNCLKVCYEILPGARAQVLTKDLTYGVMDFADDPALAMQLTIHALVHNASGFFSGNLLDLLKGK